MASGVAGRGLLGATRHLWTLVGIIGVGWAVGAGSGTGDLSGSSLYLFFTTLLLAVGLYGSTSEISLREARRDLKLLVLAVTVGVVAKAALIALVLWLVLDDPAYLVLAVAVAQIDPLSVAALRDSSRLSPRGRTVLSVWASFDDPVTVLLTAYTAPFALRALDDSAGTSATSSTEGIAGAVGDDLLDYAAQLGWNAVLVAVAAALWLLLRRTRGKDPAHWSPATQAVAVLLLLALVVTAGGYTLMLGVAFVGLFFRPPALTRHLGRISRGAYVTAAFTLGLLLVAGVDLVYGLVLGAAAYGAQIVVGSVLARKLDRVDRVSLALGQQNGVTAVILALSLQPMFPEVVAIVAPAIVTVNCLHFAANSLWGRRRPDLDDPRPAPDRPPFPHARPVQPDLSAGPGTVALWKDLDGAADPHWKEPAAGPAPQDPGGDGGDDGPPHPALAHLLRNVPVVDAVALDAVGETD
ncbi:hypothetical protein FHS35_004070 [Streptomyces umbrinus]|uniref:hypothetical protein n=1 Tax=Streptomyces umbrinus TaxID=67370 RepID=UPI00167CECAF|nr:hypothetical protein [Streptomyces umbrinus]MCR3727215.1 hypothetical protein [Streptomyces umbrinus]GHH54468.1 hypothetical protein GCM10018775_57660 [Streptomyces umbrinus]